MKSLSAIMLLLVHISCTMLLPQVDATHRQGTIGNSCDVVNNIYEWVDETLLDHHDASTEDKRQNDAGQQVEAPVADDFCSHLAFVDHLVDLPAGNNISKGSAHASPMRNMSYDKHTPPPEA